MALEHTTKFESNKIESQPARENQQDALFSSLSSSTLRDVQRSNNRGDLAPGQVPNTRIGEQSDSSLCSTPVKDSTETREQRLDQKIKDSFGGDVFDHLKDWDWLIENRKKLEDGFKKISGQDAWDMAWRMKELSMVDGKSLIYLSKVDGPTRGNLIPKRYDIYLRRGSLRSDDYIGHLHH
jgi:hypothetical protein